MINSETAFPFLRENEVLVVKEVESGGTTLESALAKAHKKGDYLLLAVLAEKTMAENFDYETLAEPVRTEVGNLVDGMLPARSVKS